MKSKRNKTQQAPFVKSIALNEPSPESEPQIRIGSFLEIELYEANAASIDFVIIDGVYFVKAKN